MVSLRLDARNAGTSDVAKKLRDRIGVKGDQSGQTANGKVRLYVIGQGALSAAAAANTKHDIANAERWNLPIILMVLVAVFGSLAAAAIPLALAVCTVVITMGLVFVLSMHTTMSVFVTSTVSMFGIALAVDYSLFILMRYREELRCGRRPPDAVDAAMATSGLAVVLSGMTVIASLTGIYLINTPALRSMATGAILAVAVAMLTSATLTPAVLATFARGGQAVSVSALVAAAGKHAILVLVPLGRVGDAPTLDHSTGGIDRAACHGGTGNLDGAGQQLAAPVRLVTRDPHRRSGRGPSAGAGLAGPGSGAGQV